MIVDHLTDATFYCDESGNTGTSWLNADQPFFIYAGWLVPKHNEAELRHNLKLLLENNNATEIKSKNFFKRSGSLKKFLEILTVFISSDCFPVFVLADKTVILSFKLIETFFDPAYNRSLTNAVSCDFELKKKLGMAVTTDPSILSDFSCLVHQGQLSICEMRNIQNKLIVVFSRMGLKSVVQSLSNLIDAEISEMINEFKISSEEERQKGLNTITLPALNFLLDTVNSICIKNNYLARIQHDYLHGREGMFNTISDIFLSGKRAKTIYLEQTSWKTSYNSIKDITLVNSEDELLIQMADLLCGFVNRIFKKMKKSDKLNNEESVILLYFLEDEIGQELWKYVCSDEIMANYISCGLYGKPLITKEDFQKADAIFSKYIN